MIDFLLRIDRGLLLRINHFNAPWLDQCMWVLSSKWINLPLAVLLILVFKRQFSWKKTSILFLLALVVVSLTDVISTQVFKDYFERLRPSHDPILQDYLHYYMIAPGYPYLGGQFGFVSSHAANLAALFAFTFPYLKKYPFVVYGLGCYVLLVSYSRVYLGVHFPSDIICGAVLGLILGWLFQKHIFAKLLDKWD
jgi:undecaprenyl-diphosphatase